LTNSYLYKTEYFGISVSEIHLFRSEYPFRKIPFEGIKSVKIKKGTSIKYPKRALIFALMLRAVPTYLLASFYGFHNFSNPHIQEIHSGIIFGSLSLLLFALYILCQLVVPTLIMKIQLIDESKELLVLRPLERNGNLESFLKFFKSSLNPETKYSDRRSGTRGRF